MSATALFRVLAVAAALSTTAATGVRAWEITDPQSWFGDPDKRPADVRVPACNDPAVQHAVADRVAGADKSYYDGLTIGSFERIEEAKLDVDAPSPLARRFCRAEVTLVAGPKTPPIKQAAAFLIEERAGFVGTSWGVEVCLYGRDTWHVYDGMCRTMRPPPLQ